MTMVPEKDRRCRDVAALIAAGGGVCDSCRAIGISEKTFQRWRRAQRDPASKG